MMNIGGYMRDDHDSWAISSRLRFWVARAALCCATGLWLTVPALAVAAAADDQSAAQQSRGLEEVVVTASKRKETVKEVPGAVTALSSESLGKLDIFNFEDYLPYVPGLSANGDNNIPGQFTVILRGLYTGSAQNTPTVGYYLDDTPLTPSSSASFFGIFSPDPDVGDVERIEVLKGPQATLYGASTLGGLIKYVYKKPNLNTFGGDVGVSGAAVTGDVGYGVRGSVNLPIIPSVLAMRVSGYDRQDPGFTDNVNT
ncbi:MAG: TonB-dependent receptor plug domain-containing protein, partial [Steroidobacteraceae bacterium]